MRLSRQIACGGCRGEKMVAGLFGFMRRCPDCEGRGTRRVLTLPGRIMALGILAGLLAVMSSRCEGAEPLLAPAHAHPRSEGNDTGVVLLAALRAFQGLVEASGARIDEEGR